MPMSASRSELRSARKRSSHRRSSRALLLGEPPPDRVVDAQRSRHYGAADLWDRDVGRLTRRGAVAGRWQAAVAGGNTVLAAPVENRMAGDEPPILEDMSLRCRQLDLHRAPAGAVKHGVEIAADRDHALAGDAAFQRQHGVEWASWQRSQRAPLLGEVLEHDAACRAMQPAVGDLVEPLAELQAEVVEVTKATRQREVLVHVAERPFDFSPVLCPVGSAGLGHGAVVGRQIEQLVIVDDAALVDPAEHGGFHPVIEDLRCHAAERLEGGDVAAGQRPGPAGRRSGPTSPGCGRAPGRTARRCAPALARR